MSDPTDLKLVIQPPPVLRATITPPADFKTTIEQTVLSLVVQPYAEVRSTIQPPTTIKTTILVGQGPSGPPGGEEMKYSKRVDFVGTDTIYKGEALPGSSETAPEWRIRKITFVNGDLKEEWAEGTSLFDKMWSSRLGYNYY